MAFQPVPSVCSVELVVREVATGIFSGAHALNFKWTAGGDPVTADIEDLVDTYVLPWFEDNYAPIMNAGLELTEINARGQWAAAAPYYVVTPGAAGSQVGDVATSKITLAVRFTTGYTGRSRRGRAFMIGLTETQLEGNVVSDAYADAVIAAWEELPVVLAPSTWEHCVVSRTVGGVKLTTADSYVITGYSLADKTIDIQKDRAG